MPSRYDAQNLPFPEPHSMKTSKMKVLSKPNLVVTTLVQKNELLSSQAVGSALASGWPLRSYFT
jgi:hypothetical protein